MRVRGDQSAHTRLLLLMAAEKLFAEHGIAAVSHRQICEAAGQRNNYAIGYHFGSRDGLLRELLRTRNAPIEALRRHMVDELKEQVSPRDWLRCLVHPQIEYLGTSPGPTHFAAFCVQMAADPTASGLLYEHATSSSTLMQIVDGLDASIPELPPVAATVRTMLIRNALISAFADFERTRNATTPSPSQSWRPFADAMVDGLLGLWLAPPA
ncbi:MULTISPECIES: TetR/AcrR family transcriptional regulator [Gordonia]|nr:TetR/AcrR family transcriptional regulator [Gordonia sp. UBA5067]